MATVTMPAKSHAPSNMAITPDWEAIRTVADSQKPIESIRFDNLRPPLLISPQSISILRI
jgi:hypothetical protein